ncbi:hypothetical protein GCM10010492_53700 [Saccharothrix mutabilis subsp. mutabilis]|uniref:CHAT domain-containing protein n=1 Tax=Saccharothrix mutabilis subsp. mutabilis TaxID=66855 RepID=A0ABN0UE44_9PSEU
MIRHEKWLELLTAVVWRANEDLGALGGGPGLVRAVTELVTAPDAESKVALVERNPLLRTDEAEWLVARCVALVHAQRSRDVFADGKVGAYLRGALGLVEAVRAGELDADLVRRIQGGQPLPTPDDDDPRVIEQHGRRLLDDGRLDAAEAALFRAVTAARAAGRPDVEGDAEIALFKVWMRTGHGVGEQRTAQPSEQWALMLAHARAAEAAYRAADDERGVQNALVAQLTVLVDHNHWTAAGEVLTSLEVANEPVARWWHQYVEAMSAREVETLIERLRWCRDSADLLGGQAEFYRRMCEGKLAALEFRPGDVVPDQTPALAAVTLLGEVGVRDEEGGRAVIARGEALVREAEKLRRRNRTQRVQRQLSGQYAGTYRLHARNLDRLVGGEQAVDVIQAATSRALVAQLWSHELWADALAHPWSRAEPRPTALEECLGRYLADRSVGNRSVLMAAFGRERVRRERQELALTDDDRTAPIISGPLPTGRLRSLLREDDRVVVYGGTGVIYLITHDDTRKIATFEPEEMGDLVEEVLPTLTGTQPPAAEDRRLEERVVDPLREHLRAGSRVFLVPMGDLWRVPLEHLGAAPLGDSHAVSCVPNLTLLGHVLAAPRLKRLIPRFVGFGDPDGSLPHARHELRGAAEFFVDTMVRVGDDLEFNPVVANMADADVLHLACHGLAFPEHPDFAALHLAGPIHRPQVLWYADLARLRLNARLVVLASCHAGTGRVLPGEEYVGFPGAFLAAGARAVVAPLWAVDDRVTAAFMDHFHRAFAHTGDSAAALRDARSRLRSDPLTADPRHWAGFRIFGAP